MIYTVEKYYVACTNYIIYRDVQLLQRQSENFVLKDTISGETLLVSKNWEEYKKQKSDILVPYHHVNDYPIYTAFRQFLSGRSTVLHSKCKLVYPHEGNQHYVVVRCEQCGIEMMQAINSGECITHKQFSDSKEKLGTGLCENINY